MKVEHILLLLLSCFALCSVPTLALKRELLTFDCNGGIHLLNGTFGEVHGSAKSLVRGINFFMEQVRSRVACKCPNLSDYDFARTFVPGKESLTAILEKKNTPIACLGNVALSMYTNSMPYQINMPSSCNAASVAAGQPCLLQANVFGSSFKITVDSCPNVGGSKNYLPFVSIACEGNNCAKIGSPCAQDSDCGDASMMCRYGAEFPFNSYFNTIMSSMYGIIKANNEDLCMDFKSFYSEFATYMGNKYFGGQFASDFKFKDLSFCVPRINSLVNTFIESVAPASEMSSPMTATKAAPKEVKKVTKLKATTPETIISSSDNKETSQYCSSSICNYYGQCNMISGIPRCLCYAGRWGEYCENTATCNGIAYDNYTAVCSGRGFCEVTSGSDTGKCRCTNGYGDNCEGEPICNGVAGSSTCGAGTCSMMSCSGRDKEKCPIKGYCICPNNLYYGDRCEVSRQNCTTFCDPTGTERNYYTQEPWCYLANGKTQCSCKYPYSGPKCDTIIQCNGIPRNGYNVCSGRGSCNPNLDDPNSSNGICACNQNTYGTNCEISMAYNSKITVKGLTAWDGLLETSEMMNSAKRKEGSAFVTFVPESSPVNTVTLLSSGCEGQISFLPGTFLEFKAYASELHTMVQKMDSLIYKLRNCGTPFSKELHRILTQLWQGDSWLFYLTQVSRSLVNNYAGDTYHLTPKALEFFNLLTKFLQMPATCDYTRYKNDGLCQLTYTGLSTLLDGDIKIHFAMGRCTADDRTEAMPAFTIQCEGQLCAEAMRVRYCNGDTDCRSNELCYDIRGNLTNSIYDYAAYVAFQGNYLDSCAKTGAYTMVDVKNLINVMTGKPLTTDNNLKVCIPDYVKIQKNANTWLQSAATATGDNVVVQGLQAYSGSINLRRDATPPVPPQDPVIPTPKPLGDFSVTVGPTNVQVKTQGSQTVVQVTTPITVIDSSSISITVKPQSSMNIPSASSNVVVAVTVSVQSLNLQQYTSSTLPPRFNVQTSSSSTPVGQVVGNGVSIQFGSTATVTQLTNVTACLKVDSTQVTDASYKYASIMVGSSGDGSFVAQQFISAVWNSVSSEMCANINIGSTGISAVAEMRSSDAMLYPTFVNSPTVSSATTISVGVLFALLLVLVF